MTFQVFSFRFFDSIRNRWIIARYKATKEEIAARYQLYEIIGEPEIRQPTEDGQFNPHWEMPR